MKVVKSEEHKGRLIKIYEDDFEEQSVIVDGHDVTDKVGMPGMDNDVLLQLTIEAIDNRMI
jgi:hypothetical protein